MLQVVQRAFSDGVATGVRLQNQHMTRRFAFGGNWRFIRLGILATVHNFGYNFNPVGMRMNFGVCSGLNGYGAYGRDFQHTLTYEPFGWATQETYADSFTYTANSGLPYYIMNGTYGRLMYTRGRTVVYSAGELNNGFMRFAATGGTTDRRTPLIITLTKGPTGTNYTLTGGTTVTTAQSNQDCTHRTFMELMNVMAPSPYGVITYTGAVSPTVQVMENTWGPLDALQFMWSCNHISLEVYEIVVLRHS